MKYRTRRAFTLVEMLIVITIVVLLVAILLPSLSTAREQSRRVTCLSRLRQLSAAFTAYAHSNDDQYPWLAQGSLLRADDWIYWEQSAGRQLSASAIAPYLDTPTSATFFQCPSDVVETRALTNYYTGYHYSYVINSHITTAGAPPFQNVTTNRRITNIRNPGQKVLLYEESEVTIDDGCGIPDPGPSISLLAIRHDRTRRLPEMASNGLSKNGNCRGNVAYADGHVDYVDRNTFHTPATYDPNIN